MLTHIYYSNHFNLFKGTNDLKRGKFKVTNMNEYRCLVTMIKDKLPNVKIYITGLFPRRSSTSVDVPSLSELSDDCNHALAALATELQIEYIPPDPSIEIHTHFTDHVHLNEEGYRVWNNQLIQWMVYCES
ncbi:MAG: SGNH/GDSL hydrolase family protein [Sphingobacteriaceae bacterium]|nr:MAG: SGNH/GDSL hydrolase family protein [Sphingobacteriaceae bacterium]